MQTGRWLQVDPLAEKYQDITPFAYVGNMPTRAIDPDGRRIFFVNGYYQDNWIGKKILGFHSAGEAYWGKGFAAAAQTFFNDHSSVNSSNFIDGSSKIGGDQSGSDRYALGMKYAEKNVSALTEGLAKGETIEFVTHSEGGAYGAGMARYLIDKGFNVSMMANLSTDEGDEFTTPREPTTYQLDYSGDWVTGNNRVGGTDRFGIVYRPDLDWSTAHGTTKSPWVFKELSDLRTVQTVSGSGHRVYENGWSSMKYKKDASSTPNGTNFQYIEDEGKRGQKNRKLK